MANTEKDQGRAPIAEHSLPKTPRGNANKLRQMVPMPQTKEMQGNNSTQGG